MDKPVGPTSHDLVRAARWAYGTKRVGHTGTLDPAASGLLLILVGAAVRLARYLVGLPKEYRGVIRLGETTATDDASGPRLRSDDSWKSLTREAIHQAMRRLTGTRYQIPPAYSAKHVAGERAYHKVRRGESFQLAPVLVEVKSFDLLRLEGPDVWFNAVVGSGTYLRSLARELGEELGCGAHLRELRRVRIGDFTVEEAYPLEAVRLKEAQLLPPLRALRHLPQVEIDHNSLTRVAHGQPVEPPVSLEAQGPAALICGGELVAVAELRSGRLQPRVVLAR